MDSEKVPERYRAWACRMSRAVDKDFRKFLSKLKTEKDVRKIKFTIVGSFHWAAYSIGYMFGGGREFDLGYYGEEFSFRRKKGGLGFKLEGIYCFIALMLLVLSRFRKFVGVFDQYEPIISGTMSLLTVIIWGLLVAQAFLALISLACGWRRFFAYCLNSSLLWAMTFTKLGFWLFIAMLFIGIFDSESGVYFYSAEDLEYEMASEERKRELDAAYQESVQNTERSSSQDSSYSREDQRRKDEKREYESNIKWQENEILKIEREIKKLEKNLADYYSHPNSFMHSLDPKAVEDVIRRKKNRIDECKEKIAFFKSKMDELDRS